MKTGAIRLLTAEDLSAHVEHSLRLMALSGIPPTPIFHVQPRHRIPTAEALTKRHGDAMAIALDAVGWLRIFGLFDAKGRVVGEAALNGPRVLSQGHRATLWLGLEPEHRSKGQGQALMDTLIAWAQEETPLAYIDLGVFAHNLAARRLYERLGFRETGRVCDAFRIDDERIDDIQMTLDLNQRRWR